MIKNIIFDIGKVLVRFDWEDYLASFQKKKPMQSLRPCS